MDPTVTLAESHFSFDKEVERPRPQFPTAYRSNGEIPNVNITSAKGNDVKVEDVTVRLPSSEEHMELLALKDKLSSIEAGEYDKARKAVNPCEFEKGIFLNRASIKLVNMLWVFELDGPRRSAADPQCPASDPVFEYADIGAGPGGFTNVIQWKHINSRGYGMTIEIEDDTGNLNWNTDVIDTSNFEIVSGPNRGDLYVGWKTLLDMGRKGRKVNLVMADGGIESDIRPRYQELYSTRLLTSEAIVGVANTKENGNFLLKIFDTVTKTMLDLIYLITQAFEEAYIFKPCSSRPFNSERYLICKGRKSNVDVIVNILMNVLNTFTDEVYVSSILGELPDDYIQWLDLHNRISYRGQKDHINGIFYYLESGVSPFPCRDLDKYYIIWGIPSAKHLPESQRRKRNRELEEEEVEAKKKLAERRNKESFQVVPSRGMSNYTSGVRGDELFGIYLHFYNTRMVGVKEEKELARLVKEIYTYCINICFGMPQDTEKYPEEKERIPWTHEIKNGFYIFRYGKIAVRYEESRIDMLLSMLVGISTEEYTVRAARIAEAERSMKAFGIEPKREEVGEEAEEKKEFYMAQVYNLVARYLPFHRYGAFGTAAKSLLPGVDAFETPLTFIPGRKYYSYFVEDSIFGSRGVFFNRYPIADTWFILPPTTEFIHRRLESAIRESKTGTEINLIIEDARTPLVKWVKESWKTSEYSVVKHSYSSGTTKVSDRSYIHGQRLYLK